MGYDDVELEQRLFDDSIQQQVDITQRLVMPTLSKEPYRTGLLVVPLDTNTTELAEALNQRLDLRVTQPNEVLSETPTLDIDYWRGEEKPTMGMVINMGDVITRDNLTALRAFQNEAMASNTLRSILVVAKSLPPDDVTKAISGQDTSGIFDRGQMWQVEKTSEGKMQVTQCRVNDYGEVVRTPIQ
jgi:hypothetical protein